MDKYKPRRNSDPDFDHVVTNPANGKKKISRRRGCTCYKWSNFNDYSENTTIHGVKYLGDQQRPLGEKIWWIIGFLLCICFLGYFIHAIYVKWEKSPVVLAQDDSPTMIYKIPFPAVTFCPANKLNLNLFDYASVTNRLSNRDPSVTEQDIKYFEVVSQICEVENMEFTDPKMWLGKPVMNISDIDIIRRMAPTFNETFVSCQLYNSPVDCSSLFNEIITEDGICYTFNIANEIFKNNIVQDDFWYFKQPRKVKDYDWNEGYLSGDLEDSYPHRTDSAGARHALSITFKSKLSDINALCRRMDQNVIALHNPLVYPQPYKNSIGIPNKKYIDIELIPKITVTSDTVKSYKPHRRQCYYNSERYLSYFELYTEQNCKLECIANITYERCGCIKFSMPRAKGIPMCGPEKISCYAALFNEAENMVARQKRLNEYSMKGANFDTKTVEGCDCLPECKLIEYDAKILTKKLDMKRFNRTHNITNDDFSPDKWSISIVNIYFKSTSFLATKRNELYGISDLISNFGGLMGLFLGGSILSLVEILYFCTIRRCCGATAEHKDNNDDEEENL